MCTGVGNHQAARREHLTGVPLPEGLWKLPKGSMAKLSSSERTRGPRTVQQGGEYAHHPQPSPGGGGSLSGLIERSSCK